MANPHLLLVCLTFQFANIIEGYLCPNRYYCHTDEVKYRSFTRMNDTYFNSTKVISSMPIKETAQCMGKCIKISKCQSINHYFENKQSQMLCDLIDANKWSNASQIQKKQNSTHYFIQSPCSSIPCKHGGTCTPLYQSGTYKCDCTANNYTVWKIGKHCEILTVTEGTANIYYAFNEKSTLKDLRSTSGKSLTVHGNAKVVRVPDRSSPVVYLPGVVDSYVLSSSYGTGCLAKFSRCGSGGLSVSLWFKILKRSHDKFPASDCLKTYMVLAESTTSQTNQGFRLTMHSCSENAIHLRIRDWNNYYLVKWGTALNTTLYQTWSHIMFTAKYKYGAILYFNGREVAREMTILSISRKSIKPAAVIFGKDANDFEAYLDDFAAWYFLLSAADVQAVYKTGLERNRAVG